MKTTNHWNVSWQVVAGAVSLLAAIGLFGCSGGDSPTTADPLITQLQYAQEKVGLIADALTNEPAGTTLCNPTACQVDSNLCGVLTALSTSQMSYVESLIGPIYAPEIKARAGSLHLTLTDAEVSAPDYPGPLEAYAPFDPDATVTFNRLSVQTSTDAEKIALWFHEAWRTISYSGSPIAEGSPVGGFTTGHAALDAMGACAVAYGASKGLVASPVLSLLPSSSN